MKRRVTTPGKCRACGYVGSGWAFSQKRSDGKPRGCPKCGGRSVSPTYPRGIARLLILLGVR